MIIGVFLRYIKTYQGINYIPLTNGDSFCGLVGNNGVGKSSVLESLDCFFNARTWNYNITTKKSGLDSTNPYIVPVFLIKKDLLDSEAKDKAELLSSVIWNIEEKDIANANKPKFRNFSEQRNNIKQKIDTNNYFLLPIGINHKGKADLSIFNCKLVKETLFRDNSEQDNSGLSEEQLKELQVLVNKLRELIQYIYIPREIDPENFTQLETQEIQVLMGETLTEILEKKVTAQQIKEINNNLNEFIDNLSNELKTYSYRTLTQRQQNLRKSDLYNLIIEAFFRIRKLHKKQGEQWLEIGSLSSGEKQKAIIDIAFNLLKHNNKSGKNLIIAVDEPESSLHMSACFDQFNALYEISRTSMQLLFASHWYGFLPVIEKGYVTIISKQQTEHPELLDFICEEKDISETSSYFALDLKPSEKDKLKQFFDRNNNKYEFASKYIERINNNYVVPDWITEIKNFITQDK